MDNSGLITIKEFDNIPKANIFKALLEDAGVTVMLTGDYMNEVLPLENVSPIQLKVALEDEQRAREILAAKYDLQEFKTESSRKADPETM